MRYICGSCLHECACNEIPESINCNYTPDTIAAKGENIMIDNELKRNGSGYVDPTAEKAITRLIEKKKRVSRVIDNIKNIADLAGFTIEERIVLKDKNTGEIWK